MAGPDPFSSRTLFSSTIGRRRSPARGAGSDPLAFYFEVAELDECRLNRLAAKPGSMTVVFRLRLLELGYPKMPTSSNLGGACLAQLLREPFKERPGASGTKLLHPVSGSEVL
jgi:hypothetical protein